MVVLAQLLGAAGEEVGWRGVVQPALETRLRLVPAGALTGLLFGLGHLGGADGFGRFLLFLGSAVLLSWALAFLTAGRGVWVRVLLATGLHWLVNLATLVGFADGDDSAAWAVANVVAAALAALAVRLVLGGSRTRTAQVPHAVRPTPTAPAAPAAPAAPEASQSKDA
ncbi:type II CAAX prenyl endopeptidase Rce1 family protein [uncultured Gordonia sp.]|uniref:CPBP family glutamic-type intramembrane protease n=1 Tax=uncultured Gordonia sp. TaxID=198437 RepID=UPI0025943E85|nr:CPBP family glutamic-type intramembrane protease [uncultured Gordonia sp.]